MGGTSSCKNAGIGKRSRRQTALGRSRSYNTETSYVYWGFKKTKKEKKEEIFAAWKAIQEESSLSLGALF